MSEDPKIFIEGYGWLTQDELDDIANDAIGCGCRMTDFCKHCNPEEWEKLCQNKHRKTS